MVREAYASGRTLILTVFRLWKVAVYSNTQMEDVNGRAGVPEDLRFSSLEVLSNARFQLAEPLPTWAVDSHSSSLWQWID